MTRVTMERILLAIGIGPVQDFIAAARKTRDLWYGSYLLSEVARATASALQRRGATMIFPPPGAPPDAAVANKILAILEDGKPASAVAEARKAATDRLMDEMGETLILVGRRAPGSVDDDLVRQQVQELLEFYAAWWPCPNDASYPVARSEVERLLAGRKVLREFSHIPVPRSRKPRQKSSLDGGRETVILDTADRGLLAGLGIKRAEQLDGISLVKRLAERKRFISISRVAIDPLIRRLVRESKLASIVSGAQSLAKVGEAEQFSPEDFPQYRVFPYDTQAFYKDAPSDELRPEATEVVAFRKEVSSLRKQLKIPEPSAYLAVLAADGDHMGKAISCLRTPAEHQNLSLVLSEFARRAAEIVLEHQGVLVYSGGDDALAFLPLDTSLDCAEALRREFEGTVGSLNLGADTPTLSVGIAVGHYAENLGSLLEWARRAEQYAKGIRNALAVALHTRTAGPVGRITRHQWIMDPVARWKRWVVWLQRDLLPDGAAHELDRLARELSGSGVDTEVARAEAMRILRRKRGKRGTQTLTEQAVAAVLDGVTDATGLLSVAQELIIARHFAEAADVAGSLPAQRQEVENAG
jgi:CRISPR-associated protein Cmr2